MTRKQTTIALCCICLLVGTFMGYWINEDTTSSVRRDEVAKDTRWIELPKEGYFYTTGLIQRAWYDGEEMDLYDFQEQLELNLVDGVLGTASRLQVMERNATDIRLLKPVSIYEIK